MAIRNILKQGEDALRKKCREVTAFNERLSQLLDDMKETLVFADGVGLAAPQVGVLKRVCIVDVGDGLIELVNPVITERRGEQRELEGCLACPGKNGYTLRPMWVKVEAYDRSGKKFTVEGEGLKARAFCHEIDHLDGILYVDKMVREIFPDEEEADGEAETDGEEEGE